MKGAQAERTSEIYEDRYLAFLDILGFSNLVRSSETDPDVAIRLVTLLAQVNAMFVSKGNEEFGASLFSDTLCLSARGGDPIAFCLGLSAVSAGLLGQGYPIRGAVVRGRLYHQGNIILGPAMLRAYDLERRLAIYPRIIIDPKLEFPIDPEAEPFQPILTDQDGLRYVNTFSTFLMALLGKVINVPFSAREAGFDRAVKRLLAVAPDEPAKQKLEWLLSFARRAAASPQPDEAQLDRYYNRVLAEMRRPRTSDGGNAVAIEREGH